MVYGPWSRWLYSTSTNTVKANESRATVFNQRCDKMDQTLHAHSKRLVGRTGSDNCYVSGRKKWENYSSRLWDLKLWYSLGNVWDALVWLGQIVRAFTGMGSEILVTIKSNQVITKHVPLNINECPWSGCQKALICTAYHTRTSTAHWA
jgi:hypothetical protein